MLALVDAVSFLVQIFVTWTAWAFLPQSIKKGGAILVTTGQAAETRPSSSKREGGGMLTNWLIYDLVMFCLVCLSFFIYAQLNSIAPWSDDYEDQEWRLQAAFVYFKIIYGMLSLPFILFVIPVVFVLFTHAKTTGYTRGGTCVRLLTKKERLAQRTQP